MTVSPVTAPEPVFDSEGGLSRLRLDLAYDGTNFHGWAMQQGVRTVEAELADALRVALRLSDTPRLVVAGRTDAGVHARGQVVHLDVPQRQLARDISVLVARLNGLLADDVMVARIALAPIGFDARFSASSRRYSYRMVDGAAAVEPLRRWFVVSHRGRLDDARMAAASSLLCGEHDFLSFCRPRPGASTVRQLQEFSWVRDDDLVATVRADAFCHHMVRSLVGAVAAVADGRRDLDWLSSLIGQPRRNSGVTVAPAHGLVLEEVEYPPESELVHQARTTRRLRGPIHES